MNQDDSVTQLLTDLERRNLNRRSFIQRGTALGLSGRAMAMVTAGTSAIVPVGLITAQETGGSFTYAVTSDPETLDPHVTSNPAASTVFGEIYSTLVYKDLNLAYQGQLAESWEASADNLELTFTLRGGVTFHDGSELTADSVKFTFERLQEVGTKSPIYEEINKITGMEVVDPLTITLTFSEPSATFLNAISNAYGAILSQSAVKAAGDDFGRQPVGSGPYTLQDWQTGSRVALAAFANYSAAPAYYENQGTAYISEMAFQVIPETFSQVAALESGEIDAVDLTATDLPRFENDDRFEIHSSNATGITYLGLTMTRPLMSDPAIRQAIAHAVDRDEIVTTLYDGGLAEPIYTALPPSIQGYDESLAESAPHLDIDRAKALLEEAGWVEGDDGIRTKDGQRLAPLLYTTTSTTYSQLATLIQSQLRIIGIDVQINTLEVASLLDFTPRGEHDLLLLGYNWADPDALYLFLSSDRLESSNRVHYSNEEFDALLTEGQQTFDQDERMEVYKNAQQILIEDLPWVPLLMPIVKTAVASRVEGEKVHPTGGLLLHDAYIAD